MSNAIKSVNNHLIETITVEPGKQPRLKLGTFKKGHPPKGFTIQLDPDPEVDAITTQVTSIDVDNESYELVLHIANFGARTIRAEVWRM